MQKYYKIVRIEYKNGRNIKFSVSSWELDKTLTIVYKCNRWVHADPALLEQGFGLCVFDDLNTAMNFLAGDEIWECKIVPMENPSPKRLSLLKNKDIVATWKYYYKLNLQKHASEKWPKGTVLAKSVKLTKKIVF